MIVSRGELVEIGGGFRVPEVLAQSGALLREVGTTNRTRAADYAAAIADRTALILRVHPSNFRMDGFTERPRSPTGRAGAALLDADGRGSRAAAGSATPGPVSALGDEPVGCAPASKAGADLVLFSGDKLLGGPQAGLIVGRRDLIDRSARIR